MGILTLTSYSAHMLRSAVEENTVQYTVYSIHVQYTVQYTVHSTHVQYTVHPVLLCDEYLDSFSLTLRANVSRLIESSKVTAV